MNRLLLNNHFTSRIKYGFFKGMDYLLNFIHAAFDVDKEDVFNAIKMVAITILCPILITNIFKDKSLFGISIMSALFTARFDPGGIYWERVKTMTYGTGLLAVSSVLAVFANQSALLLVGLVLVWTFSARMLSIFGSKGTRLGSIAIISFIIFIPMSLNISQIGFDILIILLSASWAMVIRLGKGLFQPDQPVCRAVIDCLHLCSPLLMGNHSVEDPQKRQTDQKIWQKRIAFQRGRNLAFLMVRNLKGKYTPTTWKMFLLLKKTDNLFAVHIALSECLKNISNERSQGFVQKSVDEVLEVSDRMLEMMANSIQDSRPTHGKNILDGILKQLGNDLAIFLQESPELESSPLLPRLHYVFSLLRQYLEILQSMFDIIDHTEFKPLFGVNKSPKEQSRTSLWKEHLNLQSQVFRHSVRLSIILAVISLFSLLFQIPHGYWVTLSAAVMLKPDFSTTKQRAFQRIGGTFAGGILALVLAALIHNELMAILMIMVFIFLATLNFSRHYGIYAFFWTPVIVLLINLNQVGDWGVALLRIGNTFAGGILAFLAIYFLLPQWEAERLPGQITRMASVNREFIRILSVLYAGKGRPLAEMDQIRQQTIRENVNTFGAILRLLNEPKSKQIHSAKLLRMMIYNQQLCDLLTTLSLYSPPGDNIISAQNGQLIFQQLNQILNLLQNFINSQQLPDQMEPFEEKMLMAFFSLQMDTLSMRFVGLTPPVKNKIKKVVPPCVEKIGPLICLRNIFKAYPTAAQAILVLKGINVDFYPGEFVGIIGKSGAGKTTLLNMITGVDHLSFGKVKVAGVDVHKVNENQIAIWRGQTIGVIYQSFQLLPNLSILNNVLLPIDICGHYQPRQSRQKAVDLLEQVGLGDHIQKMPSALSGGQQQRVAIARALANDPPIIVADEPTGRLDSATAEVVYQLFTRLIQQGKLIIMVSHDPTLEHRVSRVLHIVDGVLADEP